MSEKPDDKTWKDYLGTPVDPAADDYMRFCELMVEQTRQVIDEADELDADRYRVEINDGPAIVRGDGWDMDDESAVQVRDALRGHEIGDGTVTVYADEGRVWIGLVDNSGSGTVLDRAIAQSPYQDDT